MVGERFAILRPLGAGGMGSVVLAEDTWRDGRRVALKLVPDDDAPARRALENEFLLLQSLRHPSLVAAREFGTCLATRQAWLAMDHADGAPLAEAAAGRPAEEIALLIAQLARGLDFLHARGHVHGDVKAENVVVGRGSGEPRAVLLDFGLARRSGDAPQARGFSGTLTHAAPEVLAGRPADGRADLYSLGVTAHALLAGGLPFSERDPLALAEAHRAQPAPPLAARAPGVPRPLADLVDRLLCKEPDERPRDGAAVAEALDRAFPGLGREGLDAALAWAAAPGLVARDDAEQACMTLVSRARDPREDGPRVLWLVGGEGQGKSRLLGMLGARVQATRGLVLRGEPMGEPLSLLAAPLRDAIRLLGDAGPVAARSGILSAIVPELAPASSQEALGTEERLLAIADATWDVLTAVATRPTALLLDGLERCEPEDRKLIEILARRVELDWKRGRRVPFVLAGALTEEAATGGWQAALGQGRQAILAPLTLAQVEELLESMLPRLPHARRLAAEVVREGGGSPRLLEDWCAELVRHGLVRREGRGFAFDVEAPGALTPPPGAAEQAARELASLPQPSSRLLSAVAEAPSPIPTSLAAKAAGLRRDEAEPALDLLERRRLVTVAALPGGSLVSPSSARLRQAARRPGAEGAALAGRLLDAASGALGTADRAVLSERAGLLDEARRLFALALSEAEARHDASRGAALAGRLADLSQGRARRDALRRQALCLLEAERVEDAAACAAAARAEGLSEADEHGAQLLVEGTAARRRGQFAEAAALLRKALDIERASGAASFGLELELARTLLVLRDPEAERFAEALLRRPGLAADERLAVGLLASSRHLRAREDGAARAVLESVRRDARELGRELTLAACENNLGIVELRSENLPEARRHFDRAVRLRRRNGIRGPLAGTLSNLALVAMRRGRWREAARHARAAAEVQEDVGNRQGELVALLNELAALLNAEEPARAAAVRARAVALAADVRDPVLASALLLLQAEESFQLGLVPQARGLAEHALQTARSAGEAVRDVEARVHLARFDGDARTAEALAEELLACGSRSAPLSPELAVPLAMRLSGLPACWLRPWLGASAGSPLAAAVAAAALDGPGARRELVQPEEIAVRLSLAAARVDAGAPAAEVARMIRRVPDGAGGPISAILAVKAAQAWLHWTESRPAEAELRLEEAVDVLRRAAQALPQPARQAFLDRPDRAAFRSALLELRRRRLEQAKDAGWEALRPPRRAPGRKRPADAPAARPARESRRRADRLAEILEIARGISALIPVDELLSRALDSAMRFMDADRGFIVLGRPGESLRFAIARDREGRDVPRASFAVSRSVLDEVVRTRQAVLSSDAREDARFVSKVSVLALDLRSVLVAPLVASSEVIGAIYLDNLQASGVFGEEERELLGLLASQAAVAVENARLHAARVDQERIEQELSVARGIQQSLLPRALPAGGSFRLAAVMQPARELGGDWYDVVPGAGESFTLTVGDVSGKGVGAALFMVMARTILRAELDEAQPLDEWLVAANAEIAAQIDDDKFLTLVALRAGGEGHVLRYALAGHEPPIVHRAADGSAEAVEEGGLALGMLPSLSGRIQERRLELGAGDAVVLVSDGVTECRSPTGELFGRRRLRDAVAASAGGGAEALLGGLLRAIDAWRGPGERSDDVTIVVLEARGQGDGRD